MNLILPTRFNNQSFESTSSDFVGRRDAAKILNCSVQAVDKWRIQKVLIGSKMKNETKFSKPYLLKIAKIRKLNETSWKQIAKQVKP